MRVLAMMMLVALVGCAASPHHQQPSEVAVDASDGTGALEVFAGVFNMDDELGRAEVSLLFVWADGREKVFLDHWKLPDWNLVDGRDTPGTYINVSARVSELRQTVVVVDHLRKRRRSYSIIAGNERPVVAFVLGPTKIALVATNGNGERATEEPG